jgi:hypothetical protein
VTVEVSAVNPLPPADPAAPVLPALWKTAPEPAEAVPQSLVGQGTGASAEGMLGPRILWIVAGFPGVLFRARVRGENRPGEEDGWGRSQGAKPCGFGGQGQDVREGDKQSLTPISHAAFGGVQYCCGEAMSTKD